MSIVGIASGRGVSGSIQHRVPDSYGQPECAPHARDDHSRPLEGSLPDGQVLGRVSGAERPLSGENPETRGGEDGSVEAASTDQSIVQRGASSHGTRQRQSLHGLCEETQLGLMKMLFQFLSNGEKRSSGGKSSSRRHESEMRSASLAPTKLCLDAGGLDPGVWRPLPSGTGRPSTFGQRYSHPKLPAAARERWRKRRENTYIPRTGSCPGQAGGGPWKPVVRSRLWLLPWGKRPRGQRPESGSFRSGASRREGRVARSGDPQRS